MSAEFDNNDHEEKEPAEGQVGGTPQPPSSGHVEDPAGPPRPPAAALVGPDGSEIMLSTGESMDMYSAGLPTLEDPRRAHDSCWLVRRWLMKPMKRTVRQHGATALKRGDAGPRQVTGRP